MSQFQVCTMMVTKHNTCTNTTLDDEEGCKKELVDVKKKNGKEEKQPSSNVEGSITLREQRQQTNEQKEQQQQQPLQNHIVKFTDVHVREFERVIDTSANMHMTLTLGWAYIDKPPKAIISEDIEVFKNRDDTSRKDDDNVDDDYDEYQCVDDDKNSSSSLVLRGGSEARAHKKLPHERYLIFLRYGYTREQLKDASLETKHNAKQKRLDEIHKQQLKAIVVDHRVHVRQVEMTRKTRRTRTPPPKTRIQYPCRSSCSGIRGKPFWK